MNRLFIDVNTLQMFKLAYKWQELSTRGSGTAPFESGETIPMRNVELGEVQLVPVDELIEITPTLGTLMKYQSIYPIQSSDIKWVDTFRPPDKQRDILLKDINPYWKKRERDEQERAIQRAEVEKRSRQKQDIEMVYADLRSQTPDIVDLWLRITGYNLGVMQKLASVNTHFANVMRNDRIWMNALEFHYPYVSTHFMGPISKTIHPWVKQMLDTITTDPTHRNQRYPKRLMELRERFRLASTLKIPVVLPGSPFQGAGDRRTQPTLKNNTQTKWLSHIWQCGENIYGLFSTSQHWANMHIGKYLVHWNARNDHPFVTPDVKYNLIDFKTEKIRLVDFDQDGFILVVEKESEDKRSLVYVKGIRPHIITTTSQKELRIPKNTFEESFEFVLLSENVSQRWFGNHPLSSWITPAMIVIDHKRIVARTPENGVNMDSIVLLDEGLEIIAVIGYNTVILARPSGDNTFEHFFAYDMLNPQGYRTGPVLSASALQDYVDKIFFPRPRLGMGMGGIMFHWHHTEKRMACFDYSELKVGRSEIIYYLPKITLTSEAIGLKCITCSDQAKFKETTDSEKLFCGPDCQQKYNQDL